MGGRGIRFGQRQGKAFVGLASALGSFCFVFEIGLGWEDWIGKREIGKTASKSEERCKSGGVDRKDALIP